jgi:hypothetical protein
MNNKLMSKQSEKRIRKRLLFDETKSIGLGCIPCPDKDLCGGINAPDLFDCSQLCCDDADKCDYACPKDIENYVKLVQSVKGYDFNSIPQSTILEYPKLPSYVPLIYSSGSRVELFDYEVVAVPLPRLYDYDKNKFKFSSKKELCDYFGFSQKCKIVISGVEKDVPLEKYWFIRQTKEFVKQLLNLQPILVTSPNFSTFSNAPRMNDLFNLKRILICWSELVEQGIPTSLHTNGRTPKDWERLTEFIITRSEIKSISFEFATIFPERKSWYVSRLIELSQNVNRDLQLVVRGGSKYLQFLKTAFNEVVFIDTDAFIKSVKRKQIQSNGKPLDVSSPHNIYIDDLLKENSRMKRNIIEPQFKS